MAYLSGAIALASCATPIDHHTVSGKPEHVFTASPDKVRSALLTELVNRQYNITQESQSLIVGEKHLSASELGALGLFSAADIMEVASFTMIPNGGQIRVVGDIQAIQNRGKPGIEQHYDMNQSHASLDMEAALDVMTP